MSDRKIDLVWRERPFAGQLKQLAIPEGLTIAQIVHTTEDLPTIFKHHGIALVGGYEVPQEYWPYVKPKAGYEVQLGIRLRSSGRSGTASGGSHHKSTLLTVATIAIFAATLFVGGGGISLALGLGAGSTFAAGGLGAALAAGAISIVGSLVLTALSPPPSADALPSSDSSSPTSSAATPQGSASLAGNTLAAGDAVFRCWGTHDVTPNHLTPPLQEIIGTDEYVECVLGLGGPHAISNIRLDDIPISYLSDIQYEINQGLPGGGVQQLVQRQGFTVQPNTILSRPKSDPTLTTQMVALSYPHAFSSRKGPDEFWLACSFSQGLSISSLPNVKVATPLRIQFKKRSSGGWINLPEIHFSSSAGTPFVKVIKFKWQVPPLVLPPAPTDEGPYLAIQTVPTQNIQPLSGGWSGDAYFNYGAGTIYNSSGPGTFKNIALLSDGSGIEIYMDPTIYAQDDYYDFQIVQGNTYRVSNFVASTYFLNGVNGNHIYDMFGYNIVGTTSYLSYDRATVFDQIQLVRASSVWHQAPVLKEGFATISLKIKNQQFSRIVCTASGLVPQWTGTEWSGYAASSDPAANFVFALTGNISRQTIPLDLLDNTGILAWQTYCASNSLTVNMALQGKTIEDVTQIIASCGYARLRRGELWGVIIDKDRSADGIAQLFSPRNSTNASFQKAFTNPPCGFRATFDDITDNYNPTEIVVLRPGATDTGVYEAIRYDGLVTAATATKRAQFDLNQLVKRSTFYKRNVMIEHMRCVNGDLVGLTDDVLDYQSGYAYIKTVTVSGGNITGLVLDGTIPSFTDDEWSSSSSQWSSYSSQWATPQVGIQIRCLDGTFLTKEVSTSANDDTATLTFVTPFTNPGTSVIDAGCFIGSGPLGKESRRAIVMDIQPKDDFTADITFVDEAPSLFT